MSANQTIQTCTVLWQGSWTQTAALAREMQSAGLAAIGPCDSPMVARDVHIACAAAALNTSTTRIITCVTNPVTRHPSVMACAFASLYEMAPGRIACGIATGDSAVWGVGLRPSKLAELRDYILALKAILNGQPAEWQGARFAENWGRFKPFHLPVLVACSGPRTIRMASQVADGLILAVGVADEDLRWARTEIAAGCAEIGRDPSTLEVWYFAEVTFAQSRAVAARNTLGLFTHWLTLGGTRGKRIPDAYLEPLKGLSKDTQDLETTYGSESRGRLMVERAKRLGLYDWLVSRSPCLWGTPEEVAARLMELKDRGIANCMLYPDNPEYDNITTARLLSKALTLAGDV